MRILDDPRKMLLLVILFLLSLLVLFGTSLYLVTLLAILGFVFFHSKGRIYPLKELKNRR